MHLKMYGKIPPNPGCLSDPKLQHDPNLSSWGACRMTLASIVHVKIHNIVLDNTFNRLEAE